MTDKRIDPSAHGTLEPDVADRLLELLSNDDDFRQRFQNDPAAALQEIGHAPAATAMKGSRPIEGQPYYCMTSNKLASKEEIRRCKDALRDHLTQRANHQVIYYFEAGEMESTLRRK